MSLTDRLFRDAVHCYLDYLLTSQWRSEVELRAEQASKLGRLLAHACRQVPYYRRTLAPILGEPGMGARRRPPEDLEGLPFIDRAVLAMHGRELLAEDYPPERLFTCRTSGTSGEKLIFYREKTAHARLALMLRRKEWAGMRREDLVASLWPDPLDIPVHDPRSFLFELARRRIWLQCTQHSNREFDRAYRVLHAIRPTAIRGYSSAVLAFGRFITARQLPRPRLEAFFTSADMIFPPQVIYLQNIFGGRWFEEYGSREAGIFAAACPAGSLHVSEEFTILEVIRADGQTAAPGEIGEVVITDLDTFAMPLIRFRLGDLVVAGDRNCPCGRKLLTIGRLLGRRDEFIQLPDGRRFYGPDLYLSEFAAYDQIDRVQLSQVGSGPLEIIVAGARSPATGWIESVREGLLSRLGTEQPIVFHHLPELPLEPASRKFRFIKRVQPT